MFSINEPGWLALFLVFPVLLWARYFWRQRGGRFVFPFRVWNGDGFRFPGSWLDPVNAFLNGLSWLGVSLLIIALAGPALIEREKIQLSRGMDIIVVLDQSLSMGVQDYPPVNRFDMAREMIHRFVLGRKGDSLGLVSFGSQAILHCPPTTDYAWFLQRLDELQIRGLGDDTASGMGLSIAALHLSDSTAREKVILLLTDGDDNAGEIRFETAAKLAASRGIRVYFIGIGKQGEFPVKLVDPETGKITMGTVVTRFDEERMKSLVESIGGEYWNTTSPGSLESVIQTVDSLETVERQVSVRVNSLPIHRAFILTGTIAIVLAYFIRKSLMGGIP